MRNSYKNLPDDKGHFGKFGGRYVAETLMPLILDLEKSYDKAKRDSKFKSEMDYLLKDFVGRPSPLYFCERLTSHLKGPKIYFKRDELNHTGAHKINNCIGQILLAKRMGKKRIIAETGAGQHGVAVATVAAKFNFPAVIYMGSKDIKRQAPNVFRMKLLGAEVRSVESGSKSLKDAMNEALRDWVTNVDSTFYIIGTVAGPHPYPMMVRDFQSVIGQEVKEQIMEKEGKLPDLLMACVGGGSNAIIEPRIGPKNGHGKNAKTELGGAYVMINIRLVGTEGGDFTVGDDFRKVILIANPLVSAAAATLSTYSGAEMDDDSGDMIYVEYRAPINRASDQTEDVKLVVEF